MKVASYELLQVSHIFGKLMHYLIHLVIEPIAIVPSEPNNNLGGIEHVLAGSFD